MFQTKIDSGTISIPLDKCKLIDPNIDAPISTEKRNKDTGEIISEIDTYGEPYKKYYEDGTYIKIWLSGQFDYVFNVRTCKKERVQRDYLSILINSKWLKPINKGDKHKYFEGITKDTFKLLYDNIMQLNVFSCTYEAFKNARYMDTDLCFDFKSTPEQFKVLNDSLINMALEKRDFVRAKNNDNIWTPTYKKPREQATPKKPYIKFYDKYKNFTEGKPEHIQFAKYYFKKNEYKNIFRCEATIKNSEHKEKLGINKEFKTIYSLLDADLRIILNTIVKSYFCKTQSKQIDNKEDKQTPQVQTMIDLVNMLIQDGRSNVEIERAFTKRYKGKRLQRQRELYHKVMRHQEIDKETLEQNSSVNDVLNYLGFEFDPNQTKLDLEK